MNNNSTLTLILVLLANSILTFIGINEHIDRLAKARYAYEDCISKIFSTDLGNIPEQAEICRKLRDKTISN